MYRQTIVEAPSGMGDGDVLQRDGRPRRAGGPASDLLASKLRRPMARPGGVPRSVLIERLARDDRCPIVSVVAPAGYGKTTLLAQWAECNGQAFAWVSVEDTGRRGSGAPGTARGRARFNRPGSSALTAAELRLLPVLATHLSLPQIAEEMFLSRHTIKSQAYSLYRKLGASSRSQAVTRARELGPLEG